MKQYFLQIRQEVGVRVVEKVFDPATDKPSKVSYSKVVDLSCILIN